MYPNYFEDILTELYNSPRMGGTNDEINEAAEEFGLKKESVCVKYLSKNDMLKFGRYLKFYFKVEYYEV
ncbi:hypothetical protein FW757_17155 [Pseudoalteromonas sp. 1181_04]